MDPSPRFPRWFYLAVPVASALVAFALFEAALRVVVEPSPRSFGRLRGLELPPVRVVPLPGPVDDDPDAPWSDLVVDGTPVTHGDLFGFKREHPQIGYVWEENRTSANGWWRTNELGARTGRSTPRAVPPGRTRVAVFGDSFAAATRVPQADAWSTRLEALRPDLEVLNFGTDGYSSAQAYLRFHEVLEAVDLDVAVFLFVPWHDPWRDVNVVRSLGEAWHSHTPMPRFVLEGDGIRLVPPLYDRVATTYARNYPDAARELLDHLHAYDRFYLEDLHDPPRGIGSLVTWKFLVARKAPDRLRAIRMRIGTELDGEAFAVTRRIFARAKDDAGRRGVRVVVAVLPVHRDLRNLAASEEARGRWSGIVERQRGTGVGTIDLAPRLGAVPAADLDSGFDGTHYGPKANAHLAEALAAELR